ncbi:hypothetical protein Glove_33g301 [Diversispora epigaea]|uniref:Uncharacterized protein n=1 Tax=Diversispora epigaea TaxID=1348612 RepID=A0A397JHM0_9GLOM|nr:hypothetical protein Glove_33g301 [Diversispora epigaea]
MYENPQANNHKNRIKYTNTATNPSSSLQNKSSKNKSTRENNTNKKFANRGNEGEKLAMLRNQKLENFRMI